MKKRGFRSVEDWVSGLLIIGGLSVMLLQVIQRYVFELPTTWQDEISRYLVIWGVLIGSSVALRDNAHIRVEILYQIFPKSVKKWVNLFANLVALIFFLYLIIYGVQLVEQKFQSGQKSYTGLNLWIVYFILPLSGVLMFIRTIILIFKKDENQQEEIVH